MLCTGWWFYMEVDEAMKYQKLVDELNNLLDSAARQQQERQDKLKFYQAQFKAEEQKLRKQLKKNSEKVNRKKLKKELGMVQKAYAMLGVA